MDRRWSIDGKPGGRRQAGKDKNDNSLKEEDVEKELRERKWGKKEEESKGL